MWIDFNSDGEPHAAFKGEYDADEAGIVSVDVGGATLSVEMGAGRVGEADDTLGTGAVLWAAGPAMARALTSALRADDGLWGLRGRDAIELGAGCSGLPGAALALAGCSSVTLTDTAELAGRLAANVRRYAQTAALGASQRARLGRLRVRPLDWADAAALADLAGGEGYGLVVCADCDYATSLHGPLLGVTRAALAADASAVALFCSGARCQSTLDAFLALLAATFDVTEVAEADGLRPLTADESRRAAAGDSLRYFAASWPDVAAARAARAQIASMKP